MNFKNYFKKIWDTVAGISLFFKYGILLYIHKIQKIILILFLAYWLAIFILGLLHIVPVLFFESWSHVLTTYTDFNNDIESGMKLDITQLIPSKYTDNGKIYLEGNYSSEPKKGIFKEWSNTLSMQSTGDNSGTNPNNNSQEISSNSEGQGNTAKSENHTNLEDEINNAEKKRKLPFNSSEDLKWEKKKLSNLQEPKDLKKHASGYIDTMGDYENTLDNMTNNYTTTLTKLNELRDTHKDMKDYFLNKSINDHIKANISLKKAGAPMENFTIDSEYEDETKQIINKIKSKDKLELLYPKSNNSSAGPSTLSDNHHSTNIQDSNNQNSNNQNNQENQGNKRQKR